MSPRSRSSRERYLARQKARSERTAQEKEPESKTNDKEAAWPDPRLITVAVKEVGGVPVEEETFIFPVDRLRLQGSKKVVAFHAPHIPAFYLVTAKRLRDEGERERTKVLGTLVEAPEREEYADLNVGDDSLAMDAIGKLGSAVILAAAAVEAYANEAIDRLEEGETVEIERRGETVTVEQPEMVRRLSLEEKLDLVVPKVAGTDSIKGREPWAQFKRLNELRGEVVHVKARGRTDDPDVASVLGRLLLGEGSSCIEDAAAVILAYEENGLPDNTRKELGL